VSKLFFVIGLLAAFNLNAASMGSQSLEDWSPAHRNLVLEMLFPGGHSKALVFSYDDGVDTDRTLVALLNKYHLKGTFHLNSSRLSTENYVAVEEVPSLYKGHEVSVHGYNHQGMKGLNKTDLFYEILEDRRVLEMVSGTLVRGMAYAFGSYDENMLDTLRSVGIEYARTVESTYRFDIPENPLLWHPTLHKFEASDDEGKPDKTAELTERFLATEELSLFYIWGHSWEYRDKWPEVEDLFKRVSNRPEISYLTHIELVDYLDAYKRLKISADKTSFQNVSALDVYLRITDYADLENPKKLILRIRPGRLLKLTDCSENRICE